MPRRRRPVNRANPSAAGRPFAARSHFLGRRSSPVSRQSCDPAAASTRGVTANDINGSSGTKRTHIRGRSAGGFSVRLSRLSLLGISGLPTTAIFAGKVKTGARVQRGQLLAAVGDSHDAQEPHLDLEVNPTSPNGRSKSRAWRRSYAARSTAAGRQILSVRSPRVARLRHMHRAARQRKILAPSTQPATASTYPPL